MKYLVNENNKTHKKAGWVTVKLRDYRTAYKAFGFIIKRNEIYYLISDDARKSEYASFSEQEVAGISIEY